MNQRANIEEMKAKAVAAAELVPGFKLSYRLDEVVIATGISRSRIYEHIEAGELKTKKDGRTVVVLTHELMRFLSSLPDGEPKRPARPKR